jgi:GNAT superfamily N-acetyltransferase
MSRQGSSLGQDAKTQREHFWNEPCGFLRGGVETGMMRKSEGAMKMRIEQLQAKDLGFCAEQARREGWNPGVHDMEVFYAADPAGWFKAVDDAGRIAGCVSAVAYDAHFGFIGFFVVVPEHRGGRVGIDLGLRALEYLGGRVIGQDGVFAKVANYETWGFQLAYRNLRHEWLGGPLPEANGIEAMPYEPAMFPAVLAFDAGVFPCRREAFLERWLAMPEAVIRTVPDGGGLAGWGMRRRCVSGWKIGPLFADGGDVARALVRALLVDVEPGAPVYLDVPEVNRDGVALAESLGMAPCFGTARMYKNGAPELDVSRIYGVTSFELG